MTQGLPASAPTIVLWEDDPVRRPLVAAVLEATGMAVARPRSAEAALTLAADPAATVLVLDANVTRPSGTEFLRALRHRRRGPLPPTVALLQPGQASLRSAMRELGAARIVAEPFDPADLAGAVRELGGGGGRV